MSAEKGVIIFITYSFSISFQINKLIITMKTTLTYAAKTLKITLCLSILFTGLSFTSPAQPITVYQYRQVPDDKIEEFIKRETTYWSKVAEKVLKKGILRSGHCFKK